MSRRIHLFLLALALLGGAAKAQDSLNVTKIGQLAISGGGLAFDVVVSGSYAYVNILPAGLLVVDVSNPASPVAVGNCPILFAGSSDLAISGSYVYVVTGAGLHIIDVANPASPTEVANCPLPGFASGVAISGSYAFVAAATGGFRVIDVSNPARPRELTWISITGNAYAVAISGSYAYVTGGPSSIFSVVDIQNPAAPSVVGSCYTAAGPDFNVAVSGSYAYVSDGLNNVGIWVIDVSNPTAPAVVGNCPLLGWGAGIAVSGSYAYVAAYQTYPALRVVDVSDPSQPFEAGYYVTVAPKDPAVSGQYIYLAEGAYFGIYQFSLPNVTITLVPIISPIQIPINGGSFDFYLFADNGGQGTQTVDLWTKAVLPGGSVMSPIMGSVSVSLNPGTTAWYRQQYIPARAPSGLYTYIACAGDYPDSIWASDSLQFTKLATGDGPWVGDWNCTGEENSTAEPFITHKSALITSIMPNPFNPTTAISFELRDASFVNLRIFDTAGRLVAELVNGWREAGSHEVTFDGSALPSGIYLARLTAGDYSRVQKLALLK